LCSENRLNDNNTMKLVNFLFAALAMAVGIAAALDNSGEQALGALAPRRKSFPAHNSAIERIL
jgi:hypothetical protein